MASPFLIVGAALGAMALLGRKGGETAHGPRDGAIPASSIETTGDGRDVKVVEVENGAKVEPLPGEPVKLPPQVQTAPPPSQQPRASIGVADAGSAAVGTSLVQASLGLFGAAVKTGQHYGTQSPPIFQSSTPRTVAKAAMDVGQQLGAVW